MKSVTKKTKCRRQEEDEMKFLRKNLRFTSDNIRKEKQSEAMHFMVVIYAEGGKQLEIFENLDTTDRFYK